MRKSNLNLKIVKFPICRDYQSLICRTNKLSHNRIYMTHINGVEEDKIMFGEEQILKRGDKSFKISKNNVYFYGSINFNTDSPDYKEIENMDMFDSTDTRGIEVPVDYIYKTHSVILNITEDNPKPRVKTIDTFNFARICQYKHGCLGKPTKVVVFRYDR